MMSLLVLVLLLAVATKIAAQIPCDDAYGAHCPEASGYEVGECLKQLEGSTLSVDCLNYIAFSDACKADIDTHCTGKEYTGDALVCLTEWTKAEDLSEECKAAFPKKEKKHREMSADEKKKANKRRKIRNEAAKMARKDL